MTLPVFLIAAASDWSQFYSNHQLVSVGVRYAHLAAIVVGGGTAMALDRQLLTARGHGDESRQRTLAGLRSAHRVVVPALIVMALTGVLMTAADLDTFLASRLFWVKIGFVVALTANGALLALAERSAERRETHAWRRLTAFTAVSLVLWLATLFIGTWLTVAA